MTDQHQLLVLRAEKWLYSINCKVVIRDPFRCANITGENPDAIGWKNDVSILIEAKTSRGDFHADKRKSFRKNPNEGVGDWRFYICPPGIIHTCDLPIGWGLLWAYPKVTKRVYGVPTNCYWMTKKPFAGRKDCENTMLVSALRRLTLRGHLPEIYEGIV